jgi:hypothetical protein
MTREKSMFSSNLHLDGLRETIAYGRDTKGEVISVGDIPISKNIQLQMFFMLIRWVTIYYQFRNLVRLVLIVTFRTLLGINPLPTPIYGCNMAVLVASGISCIEVRWSTNGCNWKGAIA